MCTKKASKRFKEIWEKERKREYKQKAEKMAEAKKRADNMFKVAMKSGKEGKSVQVLPPGHPSCTSGDNIYERELVFDKLKAMNSRVSDHAMKVKKAEEKLKPMKDKKEDTRKRRASSPSSGRPQSKLSKAWQWTGCDIH